MELQDDERCDICNCLLESYFHKVVCINTQIDDDNLENGRVEIYVKGNGK